MASRHVSLPVPDARTAGSRERFAEIVSLLQPRTGRVLGREDAREITENLTGFFRVLQQWERAERMERSKHKRPAST